MRTSWPAVLALVLIGCRAQAPASAPAPQMQSVFTSQDAIRVPLSASDTSARARAFRETQRVAIEAAARVRSITVNPTRITLAVGETVPFPRFQITALDSAGRRVEGFVPSLSIQDNAIARLRGGSITALEPGTTRLRIIPTTFGGPTGTQPTGTQPIRTQGLEQPVAAYVVIDIAAPAVRTTVTRPPVGIDSMVPIELVRYLLNGARVVAGQPISVLDSNTLRGGYVYGSRYSATSSASIVSFPWTRLATLDTLRQRLERAGWGPLPAPRVTSRPGFQSSAFNTSSGTSSVFCRDRDLMAVGVPGAQGTETVVSLSYQNGQRTVCNPDTARPETNGGNAGFTGAASLIPILAPLPVAVTTNTGSGGGSDQATADARLMTDLPVAEIVEHYRRQLLAAGWTNTERNNTPSTAVATFTFRDSTARSWHGALTVIANPPSNLVDLRLVIHQTADARRRP